MADSTLRFTAREWNLVYRVALRILRAPDQAEDVAQEALLRAFRARDRFEGGAKPDSWLYRIAHNTALSHLRRPFARRYSGDNVFDLLDTQSSDCADGSPLESAIAGELAEALSRCMNEMREPDRVAFTERFLLGTTERELGDILGVSTNAAKQRAFRARRLVRNQLGSELGSELRAERMAA